MHLAACNCSIYNKAPQRTKSNPPMVYYACMHYAIVEGLLLIYIYTLSLLSRTRIVKREETNKETLIIMDILGIIRRQ